MATNPDEFATPLVLPNNCTWDHKTGKYNTKPNVERETLTVVPKALDQLRKIKGHVCVVSIAGPCRKGKSYILSKAFDQEQVFPLGHLLQPETMGIWLWVVPKTFKDSTGQEFTVVLMDSEGIDAVSSKQSDDHRIFTLSVLLSSIMIYNSAGVPNRSDLEGLDFIVKLSQRIQLRSQQHTKDQNDKHFYEAFPYFIWLLRDVVLAVPEGCRNMKDYFMKYVLYCEAEGNTEKARKTAESILKYFSGFDAFSLPPPAYDPEVIRNLDDAKLKSQVNPQFPKQIEDFKAVLHSQLSPKKSINKGEFVTGEALAALVTLFVEALNTPGTVPNVQNAWDTFVQNKCSEVLAAALDLYKQKMTSLGETKMPCTTDELRSAHDRVRESCTEMFYAETYTLSVKSIEKYLNQLTGNMETFFRELVQKNKQKTKESCSKLVKQLEKSILDPVLSRLRGPEGSKMDFKEIVEAYNQIEQQYNKKGRGDEEAKALIFLTIHSRLNDEMTRYVDILKKLKNYDALLAQEKAQKAAIEQAKQQAYEEKKRLEDESKAKQKEMELLRKKQDEEKKRLEEMFRSSLQEQREQLNNMMKTSFDELKKEREAALKSQKTKDDLVKLLETNNAKREKEIKDLQQQMLAKDEQARKQMDATIKAFQEQMKEDREASKENFEKFVESQNAKTKELIEGMRTELERRDKLNNVKNAGLWSRFKYFCTGNEQHVTE